MVQEIQIRTKNLIFQKLQAWFHGIVLAVLFLPFLVLVWFVWSTPFSAFELQITQSIQSFHPPWFDLLMQWTSATGFFPLVAIWVAAVILVLWALGYRWEAVSTLFAGAGNAALETLVKQFVVRPRPSPDMVHVFRNLNGLKESFPAGHVMANVAVMGFLIYLLLTFAKPSILRAVAIILLSSQIVLIGVSRIYEGEHWFTDVLGGYLLGVLLLAATLAFYRWGRSHFSSARRRR